MRPRQGRRITRSRRAARIALWTNTPCGDRPAGHFAQRRTRDLRGKSMSDSNENISDAWWPGATARVPRRVRKPDDLLCVVVDREIPLRRARLLDAFEVAVPVERRLALRERLGIRTPRRLSGAGRGTTRPSSYAHVEPPRRHAGIGVTRTRTLRQNVMSAEVSRGGRASRLRRHGLGLYQLGRFPRREGRRSRRRSQSGRHPPGRWCRRKRRLRSG